ALLHSPFKRGGRLMAESGERQLQNLLSMQYSTAALRLVAMEDILSGPDHLHRDLGTKMTSLRELRQQFTDSRGSAHLDNFPPGARRRTSRTHTPPQQTRST